MESNEDLNTARDLTRTIQYNLEPRPANVSVSFHTSSQKGGGVAHAIRVDEGASWEEAVRVYSIAWKLHNLALDDEAGKVNETLREQLEASVSGS